MARAPGADQRRTAAIRATTHPCVMLAESRWNKRPTYGRGRSPGRSSLKLLFIFFLGLPARVSARVRGKRRSSDPEGQQIGTRARLGRRHAGGGWHRRRSWWRPVQAGLPRQLRCDEAPGRVSACQGARCCSCLGRRAAAQRAAACSRARARRGVERDWPCVRARTRCTRVSGAEARVCVQPS